MQERKNVSWHKKWEIFVSGTDVGQILNSSIYSLSFQYIIKGKKKCTVLFVEFYCVLNVCCLLSPPM